MSDGTLAVVDSNKAEKLRSSQVAQTAIRSLAFMNRDSKHVVVASSTAVQTVSISPKIVLESNLRIGKGSSSTSKKNKKNKQTPIDMLRVSPSDSYLLSADSQGTLAMTPLEHSDEESKDAVKKEWSVSGAHQDGVQSISFAAGSDEIFATSSKSGAESCSIWHLRSDEPVALLDRPCAAQSKVFAIHSVRLGKSILISCVSDSEITLYSVKSKSLTSKDQNESKVIASECQASLSLKATQA
jgi:hypothetical protein